MGSAPFQKVLGAWQGEGSGSLSQRTPEWRRGTENPLGALSGLMADAEQPPKRKAVLSEWKGGG